ncbi:DUF2335 domain-containing protein [Gemella haemolysans]|uniref:DUF2335 domain-containing protein n=1 Tax=Gemella haemolysans TaxID=1379 RepID=UPI00290E4455|nr:DUF2335 domain-containing protein [Gemella haemolysans]MDU3832333.1 DUF2335 domain-containing protein [Gemella haemolysans]
MTLETNTANTDDKKLEELEKEMIELPDNKKGEMIQKLEMSRSITYSGAVPPPEMLREFDKIIPNGADRFMKMAEEQSAHRRKIEQKIVESNVKNENLGLVFAFFISIIGLISAAILAYKGNNVGAGVFAIPALGGLVNSFLNLSRGKTDK